MTTARATTRALQGTWHADYGQAACPLCQPERRPDQRALTIRDGRDGKSLLLYCHKSSCSYAELTAALSHTEPDAAPMLCPTFGTRESREPKTARCDDARRRERQALAVWREAKPIAGTPAETYLRTRGITCPLPSSLRFHPACWHVSAQRLPALVARVEGSDGMAVHRTYLATDGNGKAQVAPAKAMLGRTAGGAVRLPDEDPGPDAPLVVAEGIETALSLTSGLLAKPALVWAALSAAGLKRLRLPDPPGRLTIAADGDPTGRSAAQELAARARALGWRVSLLPAPEGRDWNDVLMLRKVRHEHA